MTLSDKLYKILIQGGSWKTILGGLWVTIQISFFALSDAIKLRKRSEAA